MVKVGNYILKGREELDRKNPAKLMGFS